MVAVYKSRNSKDEQAVNSFLNLTTLRTYKVKPIDAIRLDFKNTVVLCDS